MIIVRRLSVGILAGMLWLLSPPLLLQTPISHAADDGIIVPGERIGTWTLTMTLTDLIHMNGTPDSWGRGYNPPQSDVNWSHLGLSASSFDDKEIVYLFIGYNPSRRYKTAQGIGYGSSKNEMERAHGIAPQIAGLPPRFQWRSEVQVYDSIGLAFVFTKCVNDPRSPPCIPDPLGTFQVTAAYVFRPGNAKRMTWGDWLRPNR
jgi:hypothetical protein